MFHVPLIGGNFYIDFGVDLKGKIMLTKLFHGLGGIFWISQSANNVLGYFRSFFLREMHKFCQITELDRMTRLSFFCFII